MTKFATAKDQKVKIWMFSVDLFAPAGKVQLQNEHPFYMHIMAHNSEHY